MTPRPATALIALGRAMAMEDPVNEADLSALAGAIAASRSERAALLSGLRQANDPELAVVIADLLRMEAATLEAEETRLKDSDEIVGLWGQRLTAGALIAAATAALTGSLAGPAGVIAVLASLFSGASVAAARLWARGRRADHTKRRIEVEALVRAIVDSGKSH